MSFLGTALCMTAGLLLLFGTGVMALFIVFLGDTIHPLFFALLLLVPVWMAAWWHVAEWATDL